MKKNMSLQMPNEIYSTCTFKLSILLLIIEFNNYSGIVECTDKWLSIAFWLSSWLSAWPVKSGEILHRDQQTLYCLVKTKDLRLSIPSAIKYFAFWNNRWIFVQLSRPVDNNQGIPAPKMIDIFSSAIGDWTVNYASSLIMIIVNYKFRLVALNFS